MNLNKEEKIRDYGESSQNTEILILICNIDIEYGNPEKYPYYRNPEFFNVDARALTLTTSRKKVPRNPRYREALI